MQQKEPKLSSGPKSPSLPKYDGTERRLSSGVKIFCVKREGQSPPAA
jgi:hypothetical protein